METLALLLVVKVADYAECMDVKGIKHINKNMRMINNDPISFIISLSESFVAEKYPVEFRDTLKRRIIFELCELCCDELALKHFDMIWQFCYKDLVNVKDVSGNKNLKYDEN